MRIGLWPSQEFWLGGGGRKEMVELCLTCGQEQGELQKFLLSAWDKNGLEANFKTEYIVTCQWDLWWAEIPTKFITNTNVKYVKTISDPARESGKAL